MITLPIRQRQNRLHITPILFIGDFRAWLGFFALASQCYRNGTSQQWRPNPKDFGANLRGAITLGDAALSTGGDVTFGERLCGDICIATSGHYNFACARSFALALDTFALHTAYTRGARAALGGRLQSCRW